MQNVRKTEKKGIFSLSGEGKWLLPPDCMRFGPLDSGIVPLMLALFFLQKRDRKLFVVAPDPLFAEKITAELDSWLRFMGEPAEIETFPENSGRSDQVIAESDSPRSLALSRALSDPPQITVASVGAALSPAPSPDTIRANTFTLKCGDSYPLLELAEKLTEFDYDDELEVTQPGEFARRGGLMDIFSFSADQPARVEFFGDEIDTIRLFDPSTQLSVKRVDEYTVVMRSGMAASKDSDCDFFDYVSTEKVCVVFVFPDLAMRHLERYGSEPQQRRFELIRARFTRESAELYDAAEAAMRPGAFRIACYPVEPLIRAGLPEGTAEQFSELVRKWNISLISRWMKEQVHVSVFARNEADIQHIREWLFQGGLPSQGKYLCVEQGDLPCGVYLPEQKKAILTGQELFGVRDVSAVRRRASDAEQNMAVANMKTENNAGPEDYADLEEGDRAVHIHHGVCIYRGMVTMTSSGSKTEMIALEFDEEAMLYIPLWQAHCITKYIGSKKTVAALSTLSTKKWGRTKAAAASSIQSLAYGMLRMQAIRNGMKSRPFPADSLDQHLFEEAFPFRPTADQLRSAEEIKRDMEAEKPMDRLLCGDVGFGKTELAMRAAFKAVAAGRQVAVLVPTTVLAQQHFYSFVQRFAGTPVMIEQLSRFRTKSEQTRIIQRLREGSLDIVIGTHRLVSKDVVFRDLGLIIIDEEQRFGVEHKEHLKRLRVTADVLTMTATPIPRTLYMSMSGIRDLSTIMSAPVRRLPVKTVVSPQDDSMVKSFISRELERGGQVYFLHNRVGTIEETAAKIAAMFPQARIGIGHGKMNEKTLEDVMSGFIEGKIDIFVCTTIVQSGIDIPNANTIIIDRADMFGLAELYQLRGRVGRWTRQAYALLLLPKSGIMNGNARQRIAAIRAYTHLGSSFRLAVRDLEIRGAGNILGAEQSGDINAVGFHLYCELLKACISQLKGETLEQPPETDLFLDFISMTDDPPPEKTGACFSAEYINSPKLRLDAYRRLAVISSEKKLDDFEAELRDRYGRLPEHAKNLLACARIRILANELKLKSVSSRDGRLYLERSGGAYLRLAGIVPCLNLKASPGSRLAATVEFIRTFLRMEQNRKA